MNACANFHDTNGQKESVAADHYASLTHGEISAADYSRGRRCASNIAYSPSASASSSTSSSTYCESSASYYSDEREHRKHPCSTFSSNTLPGRLAEKRRKNKTLNDSSGCNGGGSFRKGVDPANSSYQSSKLSCVEANSTKNHIPFPTLQNSNLHSRLCASAGDLSPSISGCYLQPADVITKCSTVIRSDVHRLREVHSSDTPISAAETKRKPTSSISAGGVISEFNDEDESSRRTNSSTMAPPVVLSANVGHGFMSRFFSSGENKQRAQQQQVSSAITPTTTITTAAATGTRRQQKEAQERKGDPTYESASNSSTAVAPYSTSSLGRYSSKFKKRFTPAAPSVYLRDVLDVNMDDDEPDRQQRKALFRADSASRLAKTDLGGAQLSRSLKTLAERKEELSSREELDSIRTRSKTIGADGRRESDSEEDDRKLMAKQAIGQVIHGKQRRPEPVGGKANMADSNGSIGKPNGTGLASRISKGIQELATSGDRLKSWKAKLKRNKSGGESKNAPVTAAEVDSGQQATAVKTDPLPRAPRAPVYKTNSVDSSYDMAMGSYDTEAPNDYQTNITGGYTGQNQPEQPEQIWMLGQRRHQNQYNYQQQQQQRHTVAETLPKQQQGFYVGLTVVNTSGTMEKNQDADKNTGVYFSENGDATTADEQQHQPVQQQQRKRAASVKSAKAEEKHTFSVAKSNKFIDDPKHYEEIDLARVQWRDAPSALNNSNMDCYHYQHQNQSNSLSASSGYINKISHAENIVQHISSQQQGANTMQNDKENVALPPPARITPFSGVIQARDGDIVKPIAFRPIIPASTRTQSMQGTDTVFVPSVSPAASRRFIPGAAELCHSNYDNTGSIVSATQSNNKADTKNPSGQLGHNSSTAFTPPTMRRQQHSQLTVASVSSSAKTDDEGDTEDDRGSTRSARARDSHSMTPGATGSSKLRLAPQPWHQPPPPAPSSSDAAVWPLRVPQPPVSQQHQQQQDSFHSYHYQQHQQQMQQDHQRLPVSLQNEYDVIAEVHQNRQQLAYHASTPQSTYPVTPTGTRTFDFAPALAPLKKVHHVQPQQQQLQQPVPPVRTSLFQHQHMQAGSQYLLHQQSNSDSHQNHTMQQQNYAATTGSLGSRNSSGIHVTPSPSDSGVAELELALREKDNELQHLRQTMEHNEQAIVRVYQEKEERWQEKLREWASRLERAVVAEQRFLSDIERLQTERTDLHNRVQTLASEKQTLQRKCKDLETEMVSLKSSLDERQQTNWAVCKQCGCVFTFESQMASVGSPEDEMSSSRDSHHLPDPPYPPSPQHQHQQQSPQQNAHRPARTPPNYEQYQKNGAHPKSPTPVDDVLRGEVDSLKREVACLRQSLHSQVNSFTNERRRWDTEKQRVLEYQKLLQETFNAQMQQQPQQQQSESVGQQQQQQHHHSTRSTPISSLKTKEVNGQMVTYFALPQQSSASPYNSNNSDNASFNLVHSEPELEV